MEGVPGKVNKAIVRGDAEQVRAFASNGGKVAAEKRRAEKAERDEQNAIHAELDAHMHTASMQEAADARRDDLLPAD